MVDSPLASLRGWMLQTGQALAMFYEIPDGVDVPEHAHGAQWGVVLEGAVDFTIGGETRTYGAGETYFVPTACSTAPSSTPGTSGSTYSRTRTATAPRRHDALQRPRPHEPVGTRFLPRARRGSPGAVPRKTSWITGEPWTPDGWCVSGDDLIRHMDEAGVDRARDVPRLRPGRRLRPDDGRLHRRPRRSPS